MDVLRLIRQLTVQKKLIEHAIADLEQVLTIESGAAYGDSGKKRGRKGMDPEERRIVSERMTKYWADRRKGP